jgi:hypothetical protein
MEWGAGKAGGGNTTHDAMIYDTMDGRTDARTIDEFYKLQCNARLFSLKSVLSFECDINGYRLCLRIIRTPSLHRYSY